MSLQLNQTQLDSYNKGTSKGRGTLINNWHEEAQIREETGHGRTKQNQHIYKKHDELFNLPPDEVPCMQEALKNHVNTTTRIFGNNAPEVPQPASKQLYYIIQKLGSVGGSNNPADSIRKVGRKQELMEQKCLQQIEQEFRQDNPFQANPNDHFKTTSQTSFSSPQQVSNTIGRRIMKTQDNQPFDAKKKDVDLLCDAGFIQKAQLTKDQDLKNILPQQSYLTAKPITIYTEKQNHGIFYGSNAVHDNRPFHKSDDFVNHVKK